ncbi:glucosamine kinase [Mycolicibacterium hodleri]|uniref:Glucosamine kinase n=1 Tax=Mycolicibacterium hodleri TaxID=49897 RepID=A0A502EEH0_9MYCO|nr:glucosamine kinase [Mycolicibacterium hodleri]TPG36103.1 aminoglycoside phosphotransferase [Mycolicibacterium hodleri]
MTEPVDALNLTDDKRLAIVTGADGLAAVPEARDADRRWRRARAGDGVAEALLELLARGSATRGAFSIRSWTSRISKGERTVGVDQTNESVIVGDVAVVKWATHLQDGPHPAPRRISVLRHGGFKGMPSPWGVITWEPPNGAATLAANVDDYLPGAVDGWTWAVDLITDAARDHDCAPLAAATRRVGKVVAELHAALSETATLASRTDAARWRDGAFHTLDTVCALNDVTSTACARTYRLDIERILDRLGGLAGTPVIEGHGDLHVGQILRSQGRFLVTDFDGNPVLDAPQRMLPIPTALDVAGMTQSLAHAGIVAAKYTSLEPAALAAADAAGRAAFLDAYADRLTRLGHADLYDPRSLAAFRVQQVLREIVYAARHLPRWMYVPDTALPALLHEGTPE